MSEKERQDRRELGCEVSVDEGSWATCDMVVDEEDEEDGE